jgi:hypothetical protein
MSKTATALTKAFSKAKLSTEEVAAALCVAPQTPRASLHRLGHWMGMRPVKLPNGRLLWDAAEVERLASGEAKS